MCNSSDVPGFVYPKKRTLFTNEAALSYNVSAAFATFSRHVAPAAYTLLDKKMQELHSSGTSVTLM